MDQVSFERGVEIGLRTAVAILRAGEGLSAIETQITELKESQEYRRNNGLIAHRAMTEADIFLAVPLAHPGDIGMASTTIDDERVALSRMSWRAAAQPTPETPNAD